MFTLVILTEYKCITIFMGFEKLQGDLPGTYSRRINIQHRLVYHALEAEKLLNNPHVDTL